jgi:DNA-directed RNA polymerase subunit L
MDAAAGEAAWKWIEERYKKEEMKESEIKFHKKNFYILDAQRYFVPNSFDFTVESIGQYDNLDIVYHACGVIKKRLQERIDQLDSGTGIIIRKSETTMPNSFDAIFKNEDYTIGKIIEYILHKVHISDKGKEDLTMLFCGFKKFHPHDSDSTIRVSYNIPVTADTVRGHIRAAAVEGIALYEKISNLFRTDKNAMSSSSSASASAST